MFKPNPQIIQRVTCSACNGHGIVFDNPCITCETKGFVQYEEEIAVRVEEQL